VLYVKSSNNKLVVPGKLWICNPMIINGKLPRLLSFYFILNEQSKECIRQTGVPVYKRGNYPPPKKKRDHAFKFACNVSTESKKLILLPPLSADSNSLRFSKSGA